MSAIEGLDLGIAHYVNILCGQGIETCQSCEGGAGHAYVEPTIEFRGQQCEGPRAFSVAMAHGLPVDELRRVWSVQDGELVGPHWAMTFRLKADVHVERTAAREADYLARKAAGVQFERPVTVRAAAEPPPWIPIRRFEDGVEADPMTPTPEVTT